MIASSDAAACVEQALLWLGTHAGVSQAACLLVDEEDKRLRYVAGYRLLAPRASQVVVDLEDQDHPLARALSTSRPVVLQAEDLRTPRLADALGRAPLLAMSLLGHDGREPAPVGVLLIRPAFTVRREVAWTAEVLGNVLRQLRALHASHDAERRIRRERMLLYSIIDGMPDPILLTDTEGRIVVANKRAEALLATRDEESEGRRRAVALNNMLFSSALGKSAAGLSGSAPREVVLVDPTDGSDLLFELMSTTSTSREGTRVVSILRNVSDLRLATQQIEENYRRLRRAEAEVRAERDRLALIIDSVGDPIIVTDPAGNIVLMNDLADRLFTADAGAGPEQVQRVRANDANFTSLASNLFLSTGAERYRNRVSLVDPRTGEAVPVEVVSGKIVSDGGEVTAIVTILHDHREALERERLYEQLKRVSAELEEKVKDATSELVHQNELLRRQALQLEQASSLKSQFLANVSHELRTPLNAILGYTSLLLKGVPSEPTEAQLSALGRIESNGRHLLSLINDVLDIARIEAGKMPLHLGDLDLPELIAEVMRELETLIERSRLVVTTEVDPGVPTLLSDRQKVKQILLNFLTNALKFTLHGSVRVACTHLPAAGEVALAVSDTGIGIAADDQARLFEDFSQAGGATREPRGAGLGLAICRRLATVLDGRITLESKPGQGSTFTLLLPVRPVTPDPEAERP
jgi:PAS domain S-box-containing protein